MLNILNAAVAETSAEEVLDLLTDGIHRQSVGAADLRGKDAARRTPRVMQDFAVCELVTQAVIAHGAEDALNGAINTGRASR